MSHFAFRQRCGRLNWKQVCSVNFDELIGKLNIDELQGVLDSVAFSQVSAYDVDAQSSEQVTKVISLMQYIIEYLLHCQESQSVTVTQMDDQLHRQKRKLAQLHAKWSEVREELSCARKQLHALQRSARSIGVEDDRRALESGASGTGSGSHLRVLVEPLSRPVKPHNDENSKPLTEGNKVASSAVSDAKSMALLVEALGKHEEQSAAALRSLLAEQRDSFLAQLSRLGQTQASALHTEAEAGLKRLGEHFEKYRVSLLQLEAEKAAQRALQEEQHNLHHQQLQITEKQQLGQSAKQSKKSGTAARGKSETNMLHALVLIRNTVLRRLAKHARHQSLWWAWNRWGRAIEVWRVQEQCAATLPAAPSSSENAETDQGDELAEKQRAWEADMLQRVAAEKQKAVVASARYNTTVARMQTQFDAAMSALQTRVDEGAAREAALARDEAALQETLQEARRDAEQERQQAAVLREELENEQRKSSADSALRAQQQVPLGTIHPALCSAMTVDDLLLRLLPTSSAAEATNKHKVYGRIMRDIAAEMTDRLRGFSDYDEDEDYGQQEEHQDREED